MSDLDIAEMQAFLEKRHYEIMHLIHPEDRVASIPGPDHSRFDLYQTDEQIYALVEFRDGLASDQLIFGVETGAAIGRMLVERCGNLS